MGGDFQCFFLGQNPFFNILPVKVIHVLVKSAVTERVSVAFNHLEHVHQVHCFTALPIVPSRPLHKSFGHLTHSKKLLLALWILFLGRHLLRKLSIALDKIQRAFKRDCHSLIENPVFLSQIAAEKIFLCFIANRSETTTQNHLMLRYNVSVSGHGNTAPVDDLLLLSQPDAFRRRPENFVLMGVPMPVRRDTADIFLNLFRDIEHISASLLEFVKLLHNPVNGVFGKNRRSKVGACLIAEDKAVLFNVNAHIPKCVGKGLGLPYGIVLSLSFLEGFRIQYGPFTANTCPPVLHPLVEALYAFHIYIVGLRNEFQKLHLPHPLKNITLSHLYHTFILIYDTMK